jgi:hypothetical protein
VPWDREQYRLEVLEPARRSGNVPPADLYVRYGLPADVSRPDRFSRQIAEVLAYWQALQTRRTYARLAGTLIAAHADLERDGRLTLQTFAAHHADARREQLARLDRLAEAEAGAATYVGLATVARLRSALSGSVSDAEVAQALGQAGIQVVDKFPELPAVPHPKHADLTQSLQQLGQRLSAAVIFGDTISQGFRVLGGFRLSGGAWLDEAAISQARSRADALPYSNVTKTPTENILAILQAAARKPGDLAALLLSEVVELLRPLADSGFIQRAIAAQAHELGLDEDEAGLIAAALLAPDTLEALRQQVQDELAAGSLRMAQRLAGGLAAEDPLRERVAALDAEVTDLSRRAGQELARGRREQAARLLADAMKIVSDDADLPERLAELPPPAPREASARMDRDHVLITWEPSPSLVGRLQYRVMRGQDRAPLSPAEGMAVVTQTGGRDVTDIEAPPGVDLLYSVFAARGGEAWSRPAVTQSVLFVPDVTDPCLAADESSVLGSWRAHPATESVIVVRGEGREPAGPDDGTPVEASLTGFSDRRLRTNTRYYYLIVASYRTPGGQRRQSAGVIKSAVPAHEPEPVTDLRITIVDDGTLFMATWTPPRYGQVRLALSDEPPTWPAGARLTQGEAARLRDVAGVPRRGPDGRDFLKLSLPPGQHHLVALTAGHDTLIAGAAAEAGLVDPVREVSARRLHDEVRLSWVWPEAATDAVVRWPGGEHHCSHRVYKDEGGVTLCVGPAETSFEILAVHRRHGGRLTAPGAWVQVPPRGVAVNYRIRRASPWRRRMRIIELTAERAARLPALVIVRSTGSYAPDDPAEGEVLERIGPQPIAPGQLVRIIVKPPKGLAWLACFAAPGVDDASCVLLFPPPAGEMRIR